MISGTVSRNYFDEFISVVMKKQVKHWLAMINGPTSDRNSQDLVVPVLCYHSVNSVANSESDPITPQCFERHLTFITSHYTVISLRTLINALVSGQHVPSDAVVITFDDGYRDNFEVVFPLLVKHGIHATMFVVTGFIDSTVDLNGSPGWEAMTWNQVRELDAAPMIEVGAHGHTHAILSDLSDSDAVEEIRLSKSRLAEELGHDIELFAYPFGQGRHISPVAMRAIRDFGFIGACSTFWRTTHRPGDQFVIGRVMINGVDDERVLSAKLEGRYDYIHPIQRGRAFLSRMLTGKGIW